MASQIEQLRASFNSMGKAQKKEFIDKLRIKLKGSTNAEYMKFLNECIQKYNNTPSNDVKTASPMRRTNTSATPVNNTNRNAFLGAAIDENEYRKKYGKEVLITSLIVIASSILSFYVGFFHFLDLSNYIFDFDEVSQLILFLIIFLTWIIGTPIITYIIYAKRNNYLGRVYLFKQLNHLDNSYSYNPILNNTQLHKTNHCSICPRIIDNNLSMVYSFTKRDFSIGLSMVKINIDGRELAVRLENAQSNTISSTSYLSTEYDMGNVEFKTTRAITNYTTTEFAQAPVSQEEFLFFSKLPNCEKATINFIGIDGSIGVKKGIGKYDKQAIELICKQIKFMNKNGLPIIFKQ